MLAHFAMRLVFGICLMLCLIPRERVPSAFFRIMMLVVLGFSVLAAAAGEALVAAAMSGRPAGQPVVLSGTPIVCVIGSFVGSIVWTLDCRRAGMILVAVLMTVSSLDLLARSAGLEVWQRDERSTVHVPQGIQWPSQVVSATVLGAALTGMLLGHRYLTAPGMPLDPLRRLNQYLGAAVLLRAVLSGWGLALLAGQLGGSTHIAWLALRWLAGIVGPAIVVVMVHQILKYKNTQAATGVLFVGVILTFIGELTADLLFREVGVPL